jgi:hypothetical protein
MDRTVIRSWTRRGVIVSTVHPQYGELTRGGIQPITAGDTKARGTWRLTDQDYSAQGVVTGDYLDAEARLLEITGWADQLDSDPTAFEADQPSTAERPQTCSPDVEQEEPSKTLTRAFQQPWGQPRRPRPGRRGQAGEAGAAAIAPTHRREQPGRRSSRPATR